MDDVSSDLSLSFALVTCAAVMVKYTDKTTGQMHLTLSHLNAGAFNESGKTKADQALIDIKTNAKPGTVKLHYWGGDGIHGGTNGERDIPAIKAAIGLDADAPCHVIESVDAVRVTVTPRITRAYCLGEGVNRHYELHSPKASALRPPSAHGAGMLSSKISGRERAKPASDDNKKAHCCTIM